MVDTRFIVSKRRFPVEIDMRDGNCLTGSIFLHYARDDTGNPETPVDLINGESRFVVFDEDTKGICFIGKDSILKIHYNDGGLPNVDSVENFTTSISIAMSDGSNVVGRVCALLSEEHPRLFDLLNREEYGFITVRGSGDKHMLVNVDYVNKVTMQSL